MKRKSNCLATILFLILSGTSDLDHTVQTTVFNQ